ncbi:MAG: hypothetical protein NVSMB17_03250 [Candidatus Dormibacteria bacterium]
MLVPIKLLIADDDEVMRDVLADLFVSDPRFTVLPTARDAASAEALAREHQPDVALLDVRMPGGGGPAAARAIRLCAAATQIVALSAHNDRDTVLQMLESGAIGYVVKGSNPRSIMEAALNAAVGLTTLSPEVAGGIVTSATAQLRVSREVDEARRALQASTTELRSALLDGEFRVVYQPKVSLVTDRTIAAEALLRWEHPLRGTVPPLDFIPLAEESGLIIDIGAWVLEEVCRQARQWRKLLPGRQPIAVALNVSARQFESNLAASFSRIIERAGIAPETLCLEVTESMVMRDPESAITTLRELKALGLEISIDDFGTGFSSLAYLKRFPIDEIKIDKSFVDGLGTDPEDTAIVAAIMGMAHALDIRVVAEGVETADQMSRLRMLGCDHAQGYFFARPGAAANLEALLEDEATGRLVGPRAVSSAAASATRVLIVDDAADVRHLARASLAAAGFDVREAATGEAALTLLREFRPACVILDIHLPGVTGFDVCRAIRSDPENRETTVVMLSADAEAADKEQAFSLKADDYMVKPFTPRDLVARVTSAIRRRSMLAVTIA